MNKSIKYLILTGVVLSFLLAITFYCYKEIQIFEDLSNLPFLRNEAKNIPVNKQKPLAKDNSREQKSDQFDNLEEKSEQSKSDNILNKLKTLFVLFNNDYKVAFEELVNIDLITKDGSLAETLIDIAADNKQDIKIRCLAVLLLKDHNKRFKSDLLRLLEKERNDNVKIALIRTIVYKPSVPINLVSQRKQLWLEILIANPILSDIVWNSIEKEEETSEATKTTDKKAPGLSSPISRTAVHPLNIFAEELNYFYDFIDEDLDQQIKADLLKELQQNAMGSFKQALSIILIKNFWDRDIDELSFSILRNMAMDESKESRYDAILLLANSSKPQSIDFLKNLIYSSNDVKLLKFIIEHIRPRYNKYGSDYQKFLINLFHRTYNKELKLQILASITEQSTEIEEFYYGIIHNKTEDIDLRENALIHIPFRNKETFIENLHTILFSYPNYDELKDNVLWKLREYNNLKTIEILKLFINAEQSEKLKQEAKKVLSEIEEKIKKR